MIKVDFQKKVSCPFSEDQVLSICKIASKFEKKIKGGVEITVVGEKEIKSINREYRGINKVTDVLSFPWNEGKFLGQIFICYPKIKIQAKTFSVSIGEEFGRMLVHGLLHLVGHDHVAKNETEKMFKAQEMMVLKAKEKGII